MEDASPALVLTVERALNALFEASSASSRITRELPGSRRADALPHRRSAPQLPASRFQAVLASMGIRFGSPEADRMMLACRIDAAGYVDFSGLETELRRRAALAGKGSSPRGAATAGPETPSRGSGGGGASSLGYEFATALAATTGVEMPPTIPRELLELPQPERVRRLAPEIQEHFKAYDMGRMTLDAFRAKLKGFGIVESPQVTRLLSQTPLHFATLLRALQADPTADGSATAPVPQVALYRPGGASQLAADGAISPSVGPHAPFFFEGRSRLLSGTVAAQRYSATGEAFNPITGTGVETACGDADRRAVVSPYSTAAASNVLAKVGGVTAREDRSVTTKESGFGGIVFGTGEIKDYGSGPGGDAHPHGGRAVTRGTGAAGVRNVFESGVGRLVFADGGEETSPATAHARFETVSQASQRTGIFGKADTTHRPLTAAGHGALDHGLLREQIYSAVRQLDGGHLTARAFRDRLVSLGVAVPPAVEKLVQVYEARGKADFGRFVRAFEEYFAAHAPPAAAAAGGGAAAGVAAMAPAGVMGASHARDGRSFGTATGVGAAFASPATGSGTGAPTSPTGSVGSAAASATGSRTTAGTGRDILAWTTAATGDEAEQQARGRRLPDRTLFDTHSPSLDIMSVQERRHLSHSAGGLATLTMASADAAALHHSRRQMVVDARARDHGSITSWAGAAPGTYEGLATAEFAAVKGSRGRARVDSPLARSTVTLGTF